MLIFLVSPGYSNHSIPDRPTPNNRSIWQPPVSGICISTGYRFHVLYTSICIGYFRTRPPTTSNLREYQILYYQLDTHTSLLSNTTYKHTENIIYLILKKYSRKYLQGFYIDYTYQLPNDDNKILL